MHTGVKLSHGEAGAGLFSEMSSARTAGNGIQGNLNFLRQLFQHEDEQGLEEVVVDLGESLCLEMDNSLCTWC